MTRYEYVTPTPAAPAQTAQPERVHTGPAADVWALLMYCIGASGAALVAGGLYLLARFSDLSWDNARFVVFVASIPWLVVGLLLVVVVWRKAWALLETLTGRDLDGSGDVGDIPDVRIIPYQGPAFTLGGVDPGDWRHFVTTICNTGDWTQKTWRGSRMPSGRKCSGEYWDAMTGGLKRIGVIANSGPRSSGNLTVDDPAAILELLGLTGQTDQN